MSIATNNSSSQQMGCIAKALDVLGDKWTPLIIKELTACPQSFSELEKGLVGISPRTLSHRMNKLHQEKIVEKKIYCEHPPRYSYCLTPKGADLQDIISSMANWSAKHRQDGC
jgi:DNA-binding HxlR family transcriptional regulator